MREFAEQFIGKECIVYILGTSTTTIQGTIKAVNDGAIFLERKDGVETVNLEYIVRIREFPRNANGKKKLFAE